MQQAIKKLSFKIALSVAMAATQAYAQAPNWTVFNTSNSDLTDNRCYFITINQKTSEKWIATFNGGLYKLHNSVWKSYNTSNSSIPSNGILETSLDKNDNLWIATQNGGIAKYDNTNFTIYTTANSGMPTNESWAIKADTSNNSVWIGAGSGGLVLYNGSTWTTYNTSNSNIPHNWVNSIAIDANGNFDERTITFLEGFMKEFAVWVATNSTK